MVKDFVDAEKIIVTVGHADLSSFTSGWADKTSPTERA